MSISKDRRAVQAKRRTDKLLADLGSLGWKPGLTPESYEVIANAGFRGDSAVKCAIICEIAIENQPCTLRGLFYRCVSAGLYPSTDKVHSDNIKRLVGELRLKGIIPYTYIVDSIRSTDKPSSWSGLNDFADTVRGAYRKDFWSHLKKYVHIITEKDAIAGTISPVTREYDVSLSPIRGNISHSFAYEIGAQFKRIKKPIFVGYLGDFDPNGMDIERDLKRKLEDHSGRIVVGVEDYCGESEIANRLIYWTRLGVNGRDFPDFDLIPLPPKEKDPRYRKFVATHGFQCAEVDALPPDELRRRVRKLIEGCIPTDEWERLRTVEELERESFANALAGLQVSEVQS